MRLLSLFAAAQCVAGHGAMTMPAPRNAIDSTLPGVDWGNGTTKTGKMEPLSVNCTNGTTACHPGQSVFWFSQGCTPGCPECDGKGQRIIRPGDDPRAAWESLASGKGGREFIVEGFVHFVMEASIVVARDQFGRIEAFDLVQNDHQNHILHRTVAPANVSDQVARSAKTIAGRIVEALDYVGVMGVEFFVTADDTLLVNELAPRPHNSGHWTMDACITCQFEQAIRAAVGHPIGSPRRLTDAEMVNLIGDDVHEVPELLRDPNIRLHLYGKTDVRPGRKMGHYTRLSPTRE